ncbi:hypothetical protein RIR_jg19459.t1 [Rhizophagus irregularis DAOM 181602=DAOM 197198]|jgi:hypothetical protein|uniref:Uncharacterized protein n=1 Tax=Rhizophagus irregularis (strain DAOM 197198w) TaxID=1432141 RepID=A0A015JQ02_RHIIW|nr:hypothetical protein RirG_210410 [Rhizophagus irregularis DAOM 197198w]GET51167.1 hypothetical protein RIR_jg19459.t1 [Rhizophagus irregularis DAOM 181602=DAOM 197198]
MFSGEIGVFGGTRVFGDFEIILELTADIYELFNSKFGVFGGTVNPAVNGTSSKISSLSKKSFSLIDEIIEGGKIMDFVKVVVFGVRGRERGMIRLKAGEEGVFGGGEIQK